MINYFVSSTFRDMQAERDALQNLILPEIRKYANIRGHDVFLTDLRWGIDTSTTDINDAMKKIMSVCMSEIEHCYPHMIILLGDRYGSILDTNTFDSFLNSPQGQSFSTEDKEKSITEMEIIHGLFHLSNEGNFTICIRDSLSREEVGGEMFPVYFETEITYAEKLSHLKEKLVEQYPENVLRYSVKWDKVTGTVTGLDEFISKLTHRLYSQVQAIVSAPLMPENAQQNADKLFITTKSQTFTGRKSYLQDIEEFMRTSEDYLIIIGLSGVGKSCLMAKIAKIYSESYSVVALFCGNSPYIKSDIDMLRNLIYRLCHILKIDYSEYAETNSVLKLKETIEMLIQQIDDNLLIIIDAIDVISAENDIVNFLPDLPYSSKCKIVVSINSNTKARFLHKHIQTIKIDTLEEEELSAMIDSQLLTLRKELPESSKNLLLKKVAYHTPLYASMVFQRIFGLNQSDFRKISNIPVKAGEEAIALYNYIEDELNNLPEHEAELSVYLAEFYHYNFHFPFKPIVLQILCAFPDGLRNEDVICIAQKLGEKISLLDLRAYLNYMSSMIYTTHNNRVHFMHKVILKAMTNKFSDDIDLIYKVSLLYFNELADDDSMKMSDFIRIAYCCKDYSAIAKYLASLYIAEENFYLNGGKEINLVSTAMVSLLKVLNEIQDKNTAFDFIRDILNGIPEKNVNELYGLCCAFLFSFGTFYTYLDISGKAYSIMRLINDKCIRVLYPYHKEYPLYLRAVYVSCEQLGMKTTDYGTRFNAYLLFHKYCLEMFNATSENQVYRLDVINDLSLSYSKLGELYKKWDWRLAVSFYEKSIETTKLSCGDSSRKHVLLTRTMHYACCEEASCIIQKAILNNMIGCSMDDEMRELLKKAKDMLLVAIEYYDKNNEQGYFFKKLAYCHMHLADWARATGITELELDYTIKMIEHAESAYKRKHDMLMYDLIRNGEFRLSYISEAVEEKEKHLKKAFLMASEIRQEFEAEVSQRILHVCGGELLLHYVDKLEHLPSGNDDVISKVCLEALSRFIPILNTMLTGDDRDKHYRAITIMFEKTLENVAIQRQLAIQALGKNDCYLAYQKSTFAYKLLLLMKGQISNKRWLRHMLDISYLLSVCSHNSRVQTYKDNTYDSMKNEEYIVAELSANAKMYYSILSYEMFFSQDDLTKKYRDIFSKCLGNHQCALYGLIEFVAENLDDSSNEDRLWEFINKINYRIPNNRTVYFDILRDKSMKKLLDEHILTIGKYLYAHFREERVQKLLYFSTLFEDITLEYAYLVMDYETVRKIIENGYDRYLELSTLYIIRKHDRREFYKRVNELKFICLKNHRKLIKQYEYYYMLSAITGSLFISEADDLFKEVLDASKSTDASDPRMHSEKSIYKFFRN